VQKDAFNRKLEKCPSAEDTVYKFVLLMIDW
jgi:hypothetical protein